MSNTPYDFKLTGDNLRRLRQSRRWSQKALAEKANLSVSTISALERGIRDMSFNTVLALCLALECRPSELLENQ